MTITLTLPEAVEGALKREAANRGETIEEFALHELQRLYPASNLDETFESPAQTIKQWKCSGIIGSYGDSSLDSPELARELRLRAETRQ